MDKVIQKIKFGRKMSMCIDAILDLLYCYLNFLYKIVDFFLKIGRFFFNSFLKGRIGFDNWKFKFLLQNDIKIIYFIGMVMDIKSMYFIGMVITPEKIRRIA
ncbi:MAG: hypothetical protein GY738_19040 [Pseudoalteromonas sp.]|nr:hypothetical protein [Pseudoalteromonas sp.]